MVDPEMSRVPRRSRAPRRPRIPRRKKKENPNQLRLPFARRSQRPFGTQAGDPLAEPKGEIALPDLPLLKPREKGMEYRTFQKEAIKFVLLRKELGPEGKDRNVLVPLPTNSGKTDIEFWLAAEALPRGKVLLIAYNVLLCRQHYRNACAAFNLAEGEIVLPTADNPKRKKSKREFYSKARFLIGTPGAVDNDLKTDDPEKNDIEDRQLDIRDFSLVLMDEVHHAQGKDSYVEVASKALKGSVQIVGFSASLAENRDKLESLAETLEVDQEDIYRADKEEVGKHVDEPLHLRYKIKLEEGRIEALAELRVLLNRFFKDMMTLAARADFKELMRHYPRYIDDKDLPTTAQLKKGLGIIGGALKLIKKAYARNSGEDIYFEMSSLHAAIFKLVNQYRALESVGCGEFNYYLNKLKKDRTAASGRILRSENYGMCLDLVSGLEDHPKVKAILGLLEGSSEQALIFVDSKEHAKRLAAFLRENGITAHELMGKGEMAAAKQTEVREAFEKGEYRVLVATSVANEGLHLVAVKTVISYSPPVRTIEDQQRRGRLRHGDGQLYTLMVEGTGDELRYYIAQAKRRSMEKVLDDLQDDFPF